MKEPILNHPQLQHLTKQAVFTYWLKFGAGLRLLESARNLGACHHPDRWSGASCGQGADCRSCLYVLHNRNYDIWYKGKKEHDHRLDRYDYLYKKEQLDPWVPRIKEAELKAAKVLSVLAVLRKCMKSASCGHKDTFADSDRKSASSDSICLN